MSFSKSRHFGFFAKGLTHDFSQKIGELLSSFLLKRGPKMLFGDVPDIK